MSKAKITNPILPMNSKAINYLGWFMSDSQNLRNWAGKLFNTDIDLNNPKTLELKVAAENSLSEIEDEIAEIKKFLEEYAPLK